MYKAFKIDGDELNLRIDDASIEYYKTLGECEFDNAKALINSNLEAFKDNNGVIDGSKLSNNWFPQMEADVFISHSHKDFDTALILAGIMVSKNLTPFIDSCVWGYADNLLKTIDKKYCKNEGSVYYDYNKRNYSTSHVHMMLTIALTKMLYNTECLIFLNTPNSIYPKNDIPTDYSDATLSPWIYAEMEMTNFLKPQTKEKHRIVQKAFSEGREDLKIFHTSKTPNIEKVSVSDFINWSNNKYSSKEQALDSLYLINQFQNHIVEGATRRTIYGNRQGR